MNIKVLLVVLTLSALLTACDQLGHFHDDHGHEHDELGHNHHDSLTGPHEDDHDHEDDNIVVTHFTDHTELFVEFPALIVGLESEFIAHITRLEDYKPLSQGVVTVTLSGGGEEDEVFSAEVSQTAGIFIPVVIPRIPVERELSVRYRDEHLDVVHLIGQYTVYPSPAVALAERPLVEELDDEIVYLKEQQWQVEFALKQASAATLRSSVNATGRLRPSAGGEVYLHASSTGHMQIDRHFPYPGMKVKQGQLLATIRPQLGRGGDVATLKAARDKTRSEYMLARHETERLEKLWQQNAVAKHRLHEAKSAEEVAKAEFDAAEQRFKQSQGEQHDEAGVPLLAPIEGVLVEVNAASGQYIHEGDMLFHIVNLERLWLEARVAEVDLSKLHNPSGAWFRIDGFDETFSTDSLISQSILTGGVLDKVTRTLPLIFEFDNPGRLHAGMFVQSRVYSGEKEKGVVIPVSAIFDDGGQEVVYVMLEGESFQRRLVETGMRDGNQIIIRQGVDAGEYVVSRGAYQLRLASASPAEAGHGHAH